MTQPDMPPERWLPVVGYEGLYEVSDRGIVRSLPRQTLTGMRGGYPLAGCLDAWGYPHVGLCRDGKVRTRKVHRLVLEAFAGPRPPGMEARHGPGGAGDAALANLQWGTPTENAADKIRDGTTNQGERHGQAKLTTAIVAECRIRAAAGANQSALAREFGVNQMTMWNALTGKTWGHVAVAPVPVTDGRGENHGTAKLTRAQVAEIRRRHASGEIQRVIASDYGVSRRTIGKIACGQRWRNI